MPLYHCHLRIFAAILSGDVGVSRAVEDSDDITNAHAHYFGGLLGRIAAKHEVVDLCDYGGHWHRGPGALPAMEALGGASFEVGNAAIPRGTRLPAIIAKQVHMNHVINPVGPNHQERPESQTLATPAHKALNGTIGHLADVI